MPKKGAGQKGKNRGRGNGSGGGHRREGNLRSSLAGLPLDESLKRPDSAIDVVGEPNNCGNSSEGSYSTLSLVPYKTNNKIHEFIVKMKG